MEGDRKAGFSVFWADDGLDTGPLLLQREADVDINDTVDSVYSRFLYPEGVRAMVSGHDRCLCGVSGHDRCVECVRAMVRGMIGVCVVCEGYCGGGLSRVYCKTCMDT